MKNILPGITLLFLGASPVLAQDTYTHQPPIEARAVDLLHQGQPRPFRVNPNNFIKHSFTKNGLNPESEEQKFAKIILQVMLFLRTLFLP